MSSETLPTDAPLERDFWPAFRTGFIALLPLWFGSVPFGIVYAVSALAAGLSPAQTVAMSLLVFAGSAQFTAVGLFAAAAPPLTIVITTLIVNARHLLLAASLAPHLRGTPLWLRALLAFQLTDESYAVGIRTFLAGEGSAGFQLGANISLYIAWPLATVIGVLLGSLVPDPAAYGLDLVFPLTFTALLVPLVRAALHTHQPIVNPSKVAWRSWRSWRLGGSVRQAVQGSWLNPTVATVLAAAILALGGALLLPGRWYILLAGIGGPCVGAWLARTAEARAEREVQP